MNACISNSIGNGRWINFWPRIRRLCGRALLALALLAPSAAWSQEIKEPARNGLVFLHLKVDTNGVALVSRTVRPGRYKGGPTRGALEYEIGDGAGRVLFQGRARDPLVERYEYEDPDEPGKIRVKEVRRESAEIVVRVPRKDEARVMRVYRRRPAAPGEIQAQSTTREFIGEIKLTQP